MPQNDTISEPQPPVVSATENRQERLQRSAAASRRAWRNTWLWVTSLTPRHILRIAVVAALAMLLYWFVTAASRALVPFLIGAALAYVLIPLVDMLGRWLPRWLATVLVIVGGLAALVGLVFAVVIPLVQQLQLLLLTVSNTALWNSLFLRVENIYISLNPEFRQMVDEALVQAINTVRGNIADYINAAITFITTSVLSVVSLLSFLLGFFVLPFWLFYAMRDRDQAVDGFNKLLPRWLRADSWAVLQILDRVFSGYVRGQLLLGVIIGSAAFFGLSVLEMIFQTTIEYKLLVSVIAGLLNLIPYVGPTLSTFVAALAGLLTSWQVALAILVLFFVIQQVEAAFLAPTVTGSSVDVHPAVIMPVMIGMSSFGFLYVLLAAPLVAIIRDLSRYCLGRLDDPALPPGVLPEDLQLKLKGQPIMAGGGLGVRGQGSAVRGQASEALVKDEG